MDLVSPWLAAVEANDPVARTAFHHHHARWLQPVQRALPIPVDTIALNESRDALQRAQQLVHSSTLRGSFDEVIHACAREGASVAATVVLLPSYHECDPVLPVGGADPVIAVTIEEHHDGIIHAHLARGTAQLTRWMAHDSNSVLSRYSTVANWSTWTLARDVPLREWLYTEGVALHTALTVAPNIGVAALLGIAASALATLRNRERILRATLAMDLDAHGVVPRSRWLPPGSSHRTSAQDGTPIPSHAGSYLAWRMTGPRVERMGLHDALRAAVDE